MRWILPALTLTALALSSPGAAAECVRPSTLRDIDIAREAALDGFRELDQARFSTYVDRSLALVACLEEPLEASGAARFHELMTLDAFVREDNVAAVHSIRAALAADPAYALPDDLIPTDHPLRFQYDLARTLAAEAGMRLTGAEAEWVSVDGAPADEVPVDRPVLLQRMDTDGKVVETAYLTTGAALPDWAPVLREGVLREGMLEAGDQGPPPPAPPLAVKVAPASQTTAERSRPPVGLIATTAGLGLITGGLYVLAADRQAQFYSTTTSHDDQVRLKATTNALTWTYIGTGLGALALGTAVVVTW